MCLILLALRVHPDYPLVVAANRDEYFIRPTAAAGFWNDAPDVLAGRDLQAGGTWLGVSRHGRFAAITNFRDGQKPRAGAPSRGALTADYLRGNEDAGDYLEKLQARVADYPGFNLLIGDSRRVGYLGNQHPEKESAAPRIRWLTPGIYGLSNHLLDTPWPKLTSAKAAFADALAQLPATDGLFNLLADEEIVPDTHLPDTGVSLEWERVLSAIFVRSPDYGTRACTVVARHHNGNTLFIERGFGRQAQPLGEIREQFQSSTISTGV